MDQGTDLDQAFKQLNASIRRTGSGLSASDRKDYVFFVSDGVTDSPKGRDCTRKTVVTTKKTKHHHHYKKELVSTNRCVEPIDQRICEPLKKKGIKIAVLYTTYLPLPEQHFYRDYVQDFQDEIGEHMKACASPGLYFQVSLKDGMSEAMDALFKKVISTPRLTH